MKTALVISSFVAASDVGASVSAFCLRRLGINVIMLPTTLFGRHPGWGPPGGQATSFELLTDMWSGLESQNTQIDAVLTGYMASPAQVDLTSDIIECVTQENSKVQIIVDPVMGDHGRLYVSQDVAKNIIEKLIPQADIITPNVWELGYISQQNITSLPEVMAATKGLGRSALVSSVPVGEDIGAVLHNDSAAFLAKHRKFAKVPHGGGDALAGAFLAHLLNGEDHDAAFAQSVSSVFNILSQAAEQGLTGIPLIQYQDTLLTSTPLKLERLPID